MRLLTLVLGVMVNTTFGWTPALTRRSFTKLGPGAAASLILSQPNKAFAKPADDIALVKAARSKLAPLPDLVEAEKWDEGAALR